MVKNADYISFKKDDLFTFHEFTEFLNADPVERASQLADNLAEYFLIHDSVIYRYDIKTISYSVVCTPLVQDYVLMMARKFIVESFKNLSPKHVSMITKMHYEEVGRDCVKLFSLQFVKDFALDMYYMLTNDDVTFNRIPKHEVHYINGYYNVKTQKFQPRNSTKHFITKDELIANPYEEPAEEEEEEEPEEFDEEEEEEPEEQPASKKSVTKQFTKQEIKIVIDLL